MGRKRDSLWTYLKSYYDVGIDSASAQKSVIPIVVLDTSAIIDLDTTLRKAKSNALEGMKYLVKQVNGGRRLRFVMSSDVMSEVKSHYKNNCVNGRREICEATFGFLLVHFDLAKDEGLVYDLKLHSGADDLRLEARRQFYQNVTGKKADQDPISATDWSLVDQALYLAWVSREAYLANNLANQPRPVFRTAVLSSDSHIYGTLDRVLNSTEGDQFREYVTAINVRDYEFGDIQ